MPSIVTYSETLENARHYVLYGSEKLAQQHIIDNLVFYDYNITMDACLYGVLGALKALDAYFCYQGFSPIPTTIDDYRIAVDQFPIRRVIQPRLTIVYQNLHILGYQNSGVDVHALRSGFKCALEIIEIIERILKTPPELK